MKASDIGSKITYRHIGYEAIWVIIGFIGSSLSWIIGTRILTTYLNSAEYGKLSLSISIVNIFSFIFSGPLSAGAFRFYNIAGNRGELYVLLHKIRNGFFLTILCIAIVAITIDNLTTINRMLIAIASIFTILQCINQISIGFIEAARRRRVAAFFRILFEFGRFGAAFLMISLIVATCEMTLFGFSIAAFFVCILHLIYLKYRLIEKRKNLNGPEHFDSLLQKNFMPYILPLVVTGLCSWPYLMLDRWSLNWFCSLEEVGVYSAVYQISFMPALTAGNYFIILLSPILFQKISDGSNSAQMNTAISLNSYFSFFLLFGFLILFTIFIFFHTFIGQIFLGQEFRVGSWMFPWFFLAGGIYAVSQQLFLKALGELKTIKLAIVSIIMVLFAFFGYSSCAFWFGQLGVVCAIVGLNVLFFLLTMWFCFKGN